MKTIEGNLSAAGQKIGIVAAPLHRNFSPELKTLLSVTAGMGMTWMWRGSLAHSKYRS